MWTARVISRNPLRLNSMDLKATYDRIAEDWDRDHAGDEWWTHEIGSFLDHIPAGGSILDIGCGPGHKSKYFTDRGFAVTGIDVSPEFIRIAREHAPAAHFETGDMRTPGELGFFDGVFFCASLLHIPKAEAARVIGNGAALLKSGGAMYVSVKEQRTDKPEEEIVAEADYGYEYERFFSYFTGEEIRSYFTQCGITPMYSAVTQARSTRWIVEVGTK